MTELFAVAGVEIVLGVVFTFLTGAMAGYLFRVRQEGREPEGVEPPRAPGPAADPLTARTRSRSAPTSTALPPVRVRPDASGIEGPTVLVADDRAELLALHGTYLQGHGFRVLTATDGIAALALARSERPAVIVLDHSMPGRSGVEVCRELKADPETADIPILLMTAHSYGSVGAAARAAGCAGFMAKPCDPSRVLREVSAHLPLS